MGGRFCSLDQLYKKFTGNDVVSIVAEIEWRPETRKRSSPEIEVIFSRNQVKTKKKGLHRYLKSVFPKIKRIPKKRSSPQFATTLGWKFVISFSIGWLFFLWSSSAQLSMVGRLNLDGGTLNLDGGTRPPASPLQFKYWLQTINIFRAKIFMQLQWF